MKGLFAASLACLLSLPAMAAMPVSFADFNVYATNSIEYTRSDIQGIVGAGENIFFSSFGVMDDDRQMTGFKNPYPYSVFTREFGLVEGGIRRGGVYAEDRLAIQNAHVDGPLVSREIRVSQTRYHSTSRPSGNFPFDAINDSLLRYNQALSAISGREASTVSLMGANRRLGPYKLFAAHASDGKLSNVFEVDALHGNIAIDANGDAREFFIIIDRSPFVTLEFMDFKLLGGAKPNQILFFFPNATAVSIKNSGTSSITGAEMGLGIPGSILAPLADIAFTNGLITGSLFVRSLYGSARGSYTETSGQINQGQFFCFRNPNCRIFSESDGETYPSPRQLMR
jgi:choice-of-anchor A domain-containing protein